MLSIVYTYTINAILQSFMRSCFLNKDSFIKYNYTSNFGTQDVKHYGQPSCLPYRTDEMNFKLTSLFLELKI